jgi:prephenate dehydrogenase
MKKILIAGAGRMGSWLAEAMCLDYEIGVFDIDANRLKYLFNTHRIMKVEQIRDFNPDLVINASPLQQTEKVFKEIIPFLPDSCILSDIASVKNGLSKFYKKAGFRFVSTHPMFGPTFGNIKNLLGNNAVIIEESDPEGKAFFSEFYEKLEVKVFEYSFIDHDKIIAYSLTVPFCSSIVFAACMKQLEVPGTTFRKHLGTAQGLFSEDNFLLSQILLSPYSQERIEEIKDKLVDLIELIKNKDEEGLHELFSSIRKNIGMTV